MRWWTTWVWLYCQTYHWICFLRFHEDETCVDLFQANEAAMTDVVQEGDSLHILLNSWGMKYDHYKSAQDIMESTSSNFTGCGAEIKKDDTENGSTEHRWKKSSCFLALLFDETVMIFFFSYVAAKMNLRLFFSSWRNNNPIIAGRKKLCLKFTLEAAVGLQRVHSSGFCC